MQAVTVPGEYWPALQTEGALAAELHEYPDGQFLQETEAAVLA